jgi:hypothetical protein
MHASFVSRTAGCIGGSDVAQAEAVRAALAVLVVGSGGLAMLLAA